jgi:acetoin utilization deacetylase AcuC-like enzyme
MKIVFHEKFHDSGYAKDGAAEQGRMEAIVAPVKKETAWDFVTPRPAAYNDIARAHIPEYIESIKANMPLYEMASYSAGGAIVASELGHKGQPAFAAIRPPGHHAYSDMSWGYCYFSNMAISLLKLRAEGRIESAFVLDFDAHTGDGTRAVLKSWRQCKVMNPMAENNNDYIRRIEEYIRENIDYVDIIGVCAGFDSYIKDVGRKLHTFDYYHIGRIIKNLSKKCGHDRRFAVLEGGYYLPDLGKNVISFCQGME